MLEVVYVPAYIFAVLIACLCAGFLLYAVVIFLCQFVRGSQDCSNASFRSAIAANAAAVTIFLSRCTHEIGECVTRGWNYRKLVSSDNDAGAEERPEASVVASEFEPVFYRIDHPGWLFPFGACRQEGGPRDIAMAPDVCDAANMLFAEDSFSHLPLPPVVSEDSQRCGLRGLSWACTKNSWLPSPLLLCSEPKEVDRKSPRLSPRMARHTDLVRTADVLTKVPETETPPVEDNILSRSVSPSLNAGTVAGWRNTLPESSRQASAENWKIQISETVRGASLSNFCRIFFPQPCYSL